MKGSREGKRREICEDLSKEAWKKGAEEHFREKKGRVEGMEDRMEVWK